MSYDPDRGDGKGSAQHALAVVACIGQRMRGAVPNSGGGEEKVGRWKRRGRDRKRNELSGRDK